MSTVAKPESVAQRLNRLRFEKSPYLLQHAANPVDWCPWGPEAFEKASKEDRPIFLSVGYSTCHWCHVMERESFEDVEIARLMNDAFVCIKVDREERPDVDNVYMAVCQAMTGGGGWPLTIIMTPDKRPFYAGTYIPRERRFGRMGMLELVPRIKELWSARRQEVLRSADQITAAIRRPIGAPAGQDLGRTDLDLTFRQVGVRFDPVYGGFGEAPKFPTPHNLTFLLRYRHRTKDPRALTMVERTLDAMRLGGVYDQIGFGFHRYSTDERWLAPHFEKMLYDQALLAIAYTEACQATGKQDYGEVAREIITYVLRDMTDQQGGFYSAEDADSEGEEGKFYLWTEQEVRQVLSEEELSLALMAYDIKLEGNFVDAASGNSSGTNILHLTRLPEELASELKISEQDLRHRLEEIRGKLFARREERVRPHKDDKILTDWNGLMIAALAKAAQVFDEPAYRQAARRGADFILGTLRSPDGRLLHRYRDGEAALAANANDYAFLIWGLIELYEATFEAHYLQAGLDLNRHMIEHFWDAANGGFFFTADDAEELLVRQKEDYDGAIPSGNSVAMLNLLRLARMTANPDLEVKAAQLGRAFSEEARKMPATHPQLMIAADFAIGPAQEVVIVGDPQAADTKAMIRAIRSKFLPNKVVLFRPTNGTSSAITGPAPFTRELTAIDGKATAYVCRNFRCDIPTTDPEKALELLGKKDRPVASQMHSDKA